MKRVTSEYLERHIGLTAACAIAYHQIVARPGDFYDGQHPTDVLNVMAEVVSRTAPIHASDMDGTKRRLTIVDLQGARFTQGARCVALADGRSFTRLSMVRSDLRAAIAILKKTGIAEPASPLKRALRE